MSRPEQELSPLAEYDDLPLKFRLPSGVSYKDGVYLVEPELDLISAISRLIKLKYGQNLIKLSWRSLRLEISIPTKTARVQYLTPIVMGDTSLQALENYFKKSGFILRKHLVVPTNWRG